MKAIIKAKKQYRSLYYLKFDDTTGIIFRGLLWDEFKIYRSLLYGFPQMEMDIYESIFSDCLIELRMQGIYYELENNQSTMTIEQVLEYVPAGMVIVIVSLILSVSGAMTADKLSIDLDNARFIADSAGEERILALISTVFRISKSDFNKMTWEEIMEHIAQGELILGGNIPAVPFSFDSPQTKSSIDFDKENRDYDSN